MLRHLFFGLLCCLAAVTYSQTADQLLREGNRLYQEERYADAEEKYRESLRLEENNIRALFNLGNALYKQGRYSEAQAVFGEITRVTEDHDKLADVLHNLGNSFLGQALIEESIEAYKDALRLSPDQEDTRYNLSYARRLLSELPPDQQPQAGEGDPGDDGEEETPGGDTGTEPREDDGAEGDEEQPGEQDTPSPDGTDQIPDRPDQLSREDAERILEALKREEERILEEVVRDDSIADTLRIEREW